MKIRLLRREDQHGYYLLPFKPDNPARPAAVEELVAESLRRLFLEPGAVRYRGFVEELTKGGRLALELEEKKTKEKTESYVFRLYRLEEGGGLR